MADFNPTESERKTTKSLSTGDAPLPEIINHRYKVLKKLGEGGMGTVFLVADQLANNHHLALKQINQRLLNDDTLQIFKQEFEVMTRLNHPHLIRVFDFGFDTSLATYYITMEYIKGTSIQAILDTLEPDEKLTREQVISIFIDLCRCLSFIHSRNIVHRDINPNNIMIDQDGTLKLMDFGLADLGVGDKRRKGTLAYMAPEILKGEGGPGLDIFALGITLFELFTNDRFYQNNNSQFIVDILNNGRQSEEYRESIFTRLSDSPLNYIIRRMIAYHSHKRYRNGLDIIIDINKTCGTDYALETRVTREAYVLGAGFVGRDEELKKLQNKLEKTEGWSRTLWVKGDIGVGKSRLFYEFRNWCQLHNIFFLEGSCYEYVHKPFGPFLPILNELLLLPIDDQQIASHGPELKKILPRHESLKEIQVNPRYDPQTEQSILVRTIVQSLIDFTGFFKEQQVVLYLNDLHWSDEGSIAVIHNLWEELKSKSSTISPRHTIPFHLYLSSRFEGITELENHDYKEQFEIIQLLPFNEGFVEKYLEAVFGHSALSQKFHRTIPVIRQKVGGNPFFLQELIKSMIDNEIIVRKERYWDLEQTLDSSKIPQDLKTLVNTRLRRLQLNSKELEILQIIALLNRKVSWAELNIVVPVKTSLLRKLTQVEILLHEIRRNQSGYIIAHDLIRDVITKTIDQRHLLHERIADRLEVMHNNTPVNYLEELAYHYRQAGNGKKAVLYLDSAAKEAENLFENEKAITYYIQAYYLLDSDENSRKVTILLSLALINLNLGNLPESIKWSQKAGELAESVQEYTRAAEAYWLLSHSLFETGDLKCESTVEKSLHMSELAGNQEYVPGCYNVLGVLYYYLKNDYYKSIAFHRKGIKIARTGTTQTGLAGNVSNVSHVFYALGDFAQAIKYADESLALYGDIPDRQRDKATALGYLVKYHTSAGNTEAAFECYRQAMRICTKANCLSTEICTKLKMIGLLFKLQRFTEAQEVCDEVGANIHKTFSFINIFDYKVLAAKLKFVSGDQESAKKLLNQLLTESTKPNEIAELNYELWCMSKEDSHRDKALIIYADLTKETPDYIYKKRLQNLKNNQPEYYSEQGKPHKKLRPKSYRHQIMSGRMRLR